MHWNQFSFVNNYYLHKKSLFNKKKELIKAKINLNTQLKILRWVDTAFGAAPHLKKKVTITNAVKKQNKSINELIEANINLNTLLTILE